MSRDHVDDIDNDDNVHGGSRRRKKPKKQKDDLPLMEECDLTEDDRRKLRRQQRKLKEDVVNEAGRRENEGAVEFLGRQQERNNHLFERVRYTREAVLDAENTFLIVKKTVQQCGALVQVPRYDAVKLASKIRSKCSRGSGSNKSFNWVQLGSECGVCFNSIPRGVTFLAGTMDCEESVVAKKSRQKGQKRTLNVAELEETKPEEVSNKDKGDADKLSAAEKAMKEMGKILRKNCKVKEGDPVELDGVKFLFNPKSFTQTVENIFNFSFLIKSGAAQIGVRPQDESDETHLPGLWVKATADREDDDDGNVPPESSETTQAVISFTMRDFRRIVTAHNLQEGMLKHRTGSKQQRRNHHTSST